MMPTSAPAVDLEYALDDGFTKPSGRVFLTGTQALVRLALLQRRLDTARGLNTGGFISGYRGSPLASLDKVFAGANALLEAQNIKFQPGLNEALAATAVMGSQQVEAMGKAKVDGVFAMWYGKGPGVDWAGDAIKHGNAYGTSPHGGVLAVAGDDHGAVSSTMSHQSDQAFQAWSLPVLNPANIQDYLDLGLYGFALSRFTGAWVGFKAISETVEGAATVVIPKILPRFEKPEDILLPVDGVHFRFGDPPSVAIEERLHRKIELAEAFARANSIDRLIVDQPKARLGIVTVGKAHGDVMEALRKLGFGQPSDVAALGIRVLKIAQSWPIERQGMMRFSQDLETVLVVEEKRPLVEGQIKDLLYALPDARRPSVIGKKDRFDKKLLPDFGELRPHRLMPVVADELSRLHPSLDFSALLRATAPAKLPVNSTVRMPHFCSGCPHNSSTVVPEGSKSFGGIGCHVMATWMGRDTIGITHMGGEGSNWVGMSPFTEREHMFQNLGDGTYFHSGSMGIRQALAAKQRMTFKILYNDAVAMTGGQEHDGTLNVPLITRQVYEEGVRRIEIVTDAPETYDKVGDLAPDVGIHHRRDLGRVQKELRDYDGVSVLVYDQTCAAEKRRRRKRGTYPDPAKRVIINDLVCEACGDCSKASNCLSVQPLETALGTKRQIDQSSCNKDFSCTDGFCPSFVTVEGGSLRKPAGLTDSPIDAKLGALPTPELPRTRETYDTMVTGIGGTGVLTIGALLAMAAHLEGRVATVLDFTGLAQKGGAVLSHIRIADAPDHLHQSRIEPNSVDAVIGCDLVVAAGDDAVSCLRPRGSKVVANAHTTTTSSFIRDPRFSIETEALRERIASRIGDQRIDLIDAHRLALAVTGDSIAANILLMGYAWQRGLLPVSLTALERAIELNGVAVDANKRAFAFGRLAAHEPAYLNAFLDREEREPDGLNALIQHRREFLAAYQDDAYADRYEALVRRVEKFDRALGDQNTLPLSETVAKQLFRLMAIKDEYEVARLYTDGRFQQKLDETFEGDTKLTFHMAPPLLSLGDKPRKVALGAWMMPVMRGLAGLRFLRGTLFDPFGKTEERRMERGLLEDYCSLIDTMLANLNHHRYGLATEIAALPDLVRGFGHVKAKGVERYHKRRDELLAAYQANEEWPIAAE